MVLLLKDAGIEMDGLLGLFINMELQLQLFHGKMQEAIDYVYIYQMALTLKNGAVILEVAGVQDHSFIQECRHQPPYEQHLYLEFVSM